MTLSIIIKQIKKLKVTTKPNQNKKIKGNKFKNISVKPKKKKIEHINSKIMSFDIKINK